MFWVRVYLDIVPLFGTFGLVNHTTHSVNLSNTTLSISLRLRDGKFGSKVGQIGPQMGQIQGFFRSDFSAFGAGAPNALKSDLKKP